jgi:tetratricopeptide (TPR) repeat protein
MKVGIFLLAAMLAWTRAEAQTTVSVGSGFAHNCFIYAKAATDPTDGVEVCNQAILRETLSRKDRAATYDNRGVMLDQMSKTEKAASDFHAAIALDPNLGDPYVNLGSMLIKQNQYPEALDQINKGIELGVSFPQIGYYDRAVVQQLMGHYKEAYYDYKKALELEPNFTQASERLKDFVVTRVPKKTPG